MELKTHPMQKTPQAIKVTREQIEATKAFQKASKIIQKLTLNHTNMKWIIHGVNVSTNIGFEKWNGQTQSTFTNRGIIEELIKEN